MTEHGPRDLKVAHRLEVQTLLVSLIIPGESENKNGLALATVRTVFNVGSGEESYPKLKVQSYNKRDCAMDSLQNILTDALTTVGHFTNRNGPFSSHSSRVCSWSVVERTTPI